MFVCVCVYNKMSLPPPVCSPPYVTSAHIVPAPACRNAWNRAKSLLEMHVNPGSDHPQVQPVNLQLLSQNRAQRETIAPNTLAHNYRPLKPLLSTAAVVISIKCKKCMSSEDNERFLLTTYWKKKAFLCSNLMYMDTSCHRGELRQSKRQVHLKGKVINHISIPLC